MIEKTIRTLLLKAGIRVNGGQPHDMQVADRRVFRSIFWRSSLGLGESYMKKWWDCQRLDEFFFRLLHADVDRKFSYHPVLLWRRLQGMLLNAGTIARSFAMGKNHYSLGNDLYTLMLGPTLAYSCAWWKKGVQTLEQAQEAKFELIGRKLKLQPGLLVLDIGCGFGALAAYLAKHYSVSVVGITVSEEQLKLGQEACSGLDVDLRLMDYRKLSGEHFDRIVSVGMFEHVEPRNYGTFMQLTCGLLKPGGIFLLHTIGRYEGGPIEPWFHRYIFSVGQIPLEGQLRRAAGKWFKIRDWHFFGGSHYYRTLLAWFENFQKAWPLLEKKYGPLVNGQFKRMWIYYLLSCAGAFKAGKLDVWQIVMTRPEDELEYQPYWYKNK